MNVLDWLRLIKYLGPFFTDPWHRRPGQAVNLHCLPEAMVLACGAASLLEPWPENFEALLCRARAGRPDATHLKQAYGPLYRVLYRDLAAKQFDPLRQVFERHLHEHWFGLLGRRNRWLRPDTISRHPRRATRCLKNGAGVGAATLRNLADSGAITAHATRGGSGRITRSYHVTEIRHIERMKQDQITFREATSLLKVGRQRVRELIEAELVHAWIDRRRVSAATWWLSKADTMRAATIGANTPDLDVGDGRTSLTSVLKTWRLRRGEFPGLMRALFADEIHAVRPNGYSLGLGGIELSADGLRAWLRNHRMQSASSLSVDEAAKRLGLKQQVAYQLVERGIIPASGQRGARHVDIGAIDAFRAAYVSLSELAKVQAVAPRTLLKTLRCRPICGPGIDGARQYFYRRDEVALEHGFSVERKSRSP